MKRRMKLLLAYILIGALTLIFGCPLWWIGMIDYLKVTVSQLPLFARTDMRTNSGSPKSRETFWGRKQKGEQLIWVKK